MVVLYGDLSALNRTSLFGRKIRPAPNSGSNSVSRSAIGPYTCLSYVSLWSSQYVLELSASRPS